MQIAQKRSFEVSVMKPARLVVLGVAVAAGVLAFVMANRSEPVVEEKPEVAEVKQDLVAILVAAAPIDIGRRLLPQDVAWKEWPRSALSDNYIRKDQNPNALTEYVGQISRTELNINEPFNAKRLVKSDRGFMSAVLPEGMRAIATQITPETGVAGFILPNDRVDVILTRRDTVNEKQSGQSFITETILTNIRVLAIDQALREKEGEKAAIGKTATLELTPRQTEILALAQKMGDISLALRSLADSKPVEADEEEDDERKGVTLVRFGVSRQVSNK